MLRGFSLESLLGTNRSVGGTSSNAHTNACNCGCVPTVLSLHGAAKERARRREAAAAAAQKPTVASLLAERAAAAAPAQQKLANTTDAMIYAMVCDDDG